MIGDRLSLEINNQQGSLSMTTALPDDKFRPVLRTGSNLLWLSTANHLSQRQLAERTGPPDATTQRRPRLLLKR